MKTQSSAVLINAIGFHTLWLVAVFGAAGGWSLWVWPVVISMFVLQASVTGQWRRDLQTLLYGALLCLLLEPIWLLLQVVSYHQWQSLWLAPHWIWALWLSFAVSFHYSFSWLQRRYWLAAAFGGIGGVFSVTMGMQFGAAEAPMGWLSFALIYGPLWAVAVPLLAFVTGRMTAQPRLSEEGPRYA